MDDVLIQTLRDDRARAVSERDTLAEEVRNLRHTNEWLRSKLSAQQRKIGKLQAELDRKGGHRG